MSVKELIIGNMKVSVYFKFTGDEKEYFLIKFGAENSNLLDRNQAHLLMLYLQEHLGYNKAVQTIPKEMWECSCGKWHMKDFVCERLGK